MQQCLSANVDVTVDDDDVTVDDVNVTVDDDDVTVDDNDVTFSRHGLKIISGTYRHRPRQYSTSSTRGRPCVMRTCVQTSGMESV